MPEKPAQELWVAIAGPLVNVAIALVLYPVIYFGYGGDAISQEMFEKNLLVRLLGANVMLFLFNLIPAFPMDGGRVLRALLSFRLPYEKSTLIAARIGQTLAILGAFFGLYSGLIVLIFISVFVFLGAEAELRFVLARKLRQIPYRVGEAMLERYTTMRPTQTLREAVRELLAGSEKDFAVSEDSHLMGILTREKLIEALSEQGNDSFIGNAMRTDFPRLRTDQPMEEAIDLMRTHDLNLLPVYEGVNWVGCINMDNITEFLLVKGMREG
jgi:predicted transcriptional regulator